MLIVGQPVHSSSVRIHTVFDSVLSPDPQCFGSIFIESGSGTSRKSESGSGSKLFFNTI